MDKQDAAKPTLGVFNPKDQKLIKPATVGELGFSVYGTRLIVDQMRISFGQGVHAKVPKIEDTKRAFSAIITASYTVTKEAKHGSKCSLPGGGQEGLIGCHVNPDRVVLLHILHLI